MTQTDSRFEWAEFYMEFADKLSAYKDDRGELLKKALPAIDATGAPYALTDQFKDGRSGLLRDICPFTLMSTFNRGITNENRNSIANALGEVLGVKRAAPTRFDSIPIVRNQASWFFGLERDRDPGDINTLWQVFEAALALAVSDTKARREAFITSYDLAREVYGVRINLSIGLYWIRPSFFVALDSNNRSYIEEHFEFYIKDDFEPDLDPEWPNLETLKGDQYLQLRDYIVGELGKPGSPVSTIPELSQAAYDEMHPDDEDDWDEEDDENIEVEYDLDSIIADGCFLPLETLEKALDRLRVKKNLILQGPPGTGKTWLAKRLAFALIGEKSDEHVRPIQFHANMSYEDFVQGFRPGADSRLELVDGPFMTLIEDAKNHETDTYVMVIEEINRGNPAQIFGEMLTLLEADKRNESEALALAYSPKRVHIPENVYVIGTMNVADRSLALVDFALRRRFAFLDLEPSFNGAWSEWCLENCEADGAFLTDIQRRLDALNDVIANDSNLGKQFRVGHSVVTPARETIMDAEWFKSVVETEIQPLLAEYWFDIGGAQKVRDQVAMLTEGL